MLLVRVSSKPGTWVPSHMRNSSSLGSFKSNLKTFLFKQAFCQLPVMDHRTSFILFYFLFFSIIIISSSISIIKFQIQVISCAFNISTMLLLLLLLPTPIYPQHRTHPQNKNWRSLLSNQFAKFLCLLNSGCP